MATVKLEWAGAKVQDAVLTVALEGEVPKGWKQSFERTIQLLGDGEWGEVRVKKSAVRVSDVEPGSEEKLRHHLESVVGQANADHEDPQEPGGDDDREDDDRDGDDPDDDAGDTDAEMTGRFRSFAGHDSEHDPGS